eukprot:scaffold175_cov414-Prasinococcus_capsulatus_cf.AAC.20
MSCGYFCWASAERNVKRCAVFAVAVVIVISVPVVAKVSEAEESLCDLRQWVYGKWQLDPLKYIPDVATACNNAHDRGDMLSFLRDTGIQSSTSNDRDRCGPLHSITQVSTAATFKMFSAEEATQCLQAKKILIAGDSYQRNLYVALLDVLQGNESTTYLSSIKGRNSGVLTPQLALFREQANRTKSQILTGAQLWERLPRLTPPYYDVRVIRRATIHTRVWSIQ